MTLADLLNAHVVAGSDYSDTIERLHASFVNLAAIEIVLQNGNVGFGGAPDLRSFHFLPQNAEHFGHPAFAPLDPSKCWRAEIMARRDYLLTELAKG
ncbi:MAG TPA: hypothetical protein VIF88_12480 [Methylocystis sp.]|jgi:hypothetical protein